MTAKELISAILLPAALLTVPLMVVVCYAWQVNVDGRAAPIKREIAQNFATEWDRCDLAAAWDKNVACIPR